MKKKLFLMVALLLCVCSCGYGQGLRELLGQKNKGVSNSKAEMLRTKQKDAGRGKTSHSSDYNRGTIPGIRVNSTSKFRWTKTNEKSDTIYYRDVVRKYGWMEGLGNPISKEIASHLPYFYRFTLKNSAGHWLHVEALHGDTLTTLHPVSTYIIDKEQKDDILANERWLELLKTVTQWVFIPGIDGTEMCEERSYDRENNLIYTFSMVRNKDGRVTGSYNDAWGLPADMREDPMATYGSVVCITYDALGYDSIIDYLDGEGYCKYNNNGVDQTRYVHDNRGYVLEAWSCNCMGDRMIDNWGNCGYSITYNPQERMRTKIFRDANWKPTRLPEKRAGGDQSYIRCDYYQDVWGRDSVAVVRTADGEDDATLSKIHCIVYHYSEDGSSVPNTYFNREGDLVDKEGDIIDKKGDIFDKNVPLKLTEKEIPVINSISL